MALAWNAGWVNALRGSNPLSSAEGKAPCDSFTGGFFVSSEVSHGLTLPCFKELLAIETLQWHGESSALENTFEISIVWTP